MERTRIVALVMLILLSASVQPSTLKVLSAETSGAIYIRVDGSVDPPDAPIINAGNATYRFIDDILAQDTFGLVIERDNIAIDGNGYTLQGLGNGSGIRLSKRENVTILNTHIVGFRYGVYLDFSSNNVIVGNNLSANSYSGINLFNSSSNNRVSGNSIESNEKVGVRLYLSNSNTIIGNNIMTNNLTGISSTESSHNDIIENNISNNTAGIFLNTRSNFNLVRGNSIKANFDGIRVELGCSDNTFYHNNLVDNSNQVYIENSVGSLWDHGYPSGGNYWSDYVGLDADGDGIGDTPHVLNPQDVDNYPLMLPFRRTPIPFDTNDDGVVDIIDCATVALAFGSISSDPNWNLIADINKDGIIDVLDIVGVALHFGETS